MTPTLGFARLMLALAVAGVLIAPAWWLAGRLPARSPRPVFRLLLAVGLALAGHLSFINLLGRLSHRSIAPLVIWIALNAAASVILWRRERGSLYFSTLTTWRAWIDPVIVAMALGVPQMVVAVGTPFWDEVASSAIHWTAVNQFAENLFPPRHNALPDIAIKYHYGVVILSGTFKWLTGLSANVSIDAVSTSLWLFVFLFIYYWLRELEFRPLAATWGSFAALLGGGLAWLYLPRIEAYNGVEKLPPASQLAHRYDPAQSWLENLIAAGRVPAAHLRNADGSLSNLPWDIAAQFQQHAAALGIAITLVALYLFVTWQTKNGRQLPLLLANILTFGVLFLAHGAFGVVAAAAAGLWLLGAWVKAPAREAFARGLAFAGGVAIIAFSHGGLLATGPEYGSSAEVFRLRGGFGYSAGGLAGFVHWHLAGFGIPLLLALVAWLTPWRPGDPRRSERVTAFQVLTILAAVSYLLPQLAFYTADTSQVEQFTEISKFFFPARLAFALLSTWGVARLLSFVPRVTVAPAFVAMAVTPVAFCLANSRTMDGDWIGFYRSPYGEGSTEQRLAEALGRLKTTNRDVYFDASADEARRGYLSEMLAFGGSVFTLTPSRYERTGIGYRLAEDRVAARYLQNGRMARLRAGAAEECQCHWYYTRPVEDMAFAPLVTRSRFSKLVAEQIFVTRAEAGPRVLYSIDKPTTDLDRGIERYWRPRVVAQTDTDVDGDGRGDLIFYDYVNRRILAGSTVIDLPPGSEFAHLYTARFGAARTVGFLLGRMTDTDFRLGTKIDEIIERNAWGWTYRAAAAGAWDPEYERWFWTLDIPLLARLTRDGGASHVIYRVSTGQWRLAPDENLAGPTVDRAQLPVPLAGRFLDGSPADLGLWSLRTGTLTLQSVTTGARATLPLGGPDDVLVPGDYTGQGYDQVGLWQRASQTWSWRRAPDGPVTSVVYGTSTSVPVPADYDHDGRLDLAYWEPADGKIYVSLSRGRSVDRVVPVPPHSLPAFVNMY